MKHLVKPSLYLLGYLYQLYKIIIAAPLILILSLLWNFSITTAINDVRHEFKVFYRAEVIGIVLYEYKTISDFVNGIKSNKYTFL